MSTPEPTRTMPWAERAVERSPVVQRSRARSIEHAQVTLEAARRLIGRQGEFTTQELVSEAGIALQTFYRTFGGKDQLYLALIESLVSEQATAMEAATADVADPMERLRHYVTAPIQLLADRGAEPGARTITAEHWRLHQLFPREVTAAARPYVELVRRTLVEAGEAGELRPGDAGRDAWLMVEVVRSVYHHYAFAELDQPLAEIVAHTWHFCVVGVGG